MTYATRATLDNRYGPDTVTQAAWRETGDADAAIAAALAGTDTLIDGYLVAGDYALPLDPVPALLADIATDIAWYKLVRPPHDDGTITRYKDAVRQLEAIQAGRIALQVSGAPVDPSPAPAVVVEAAAKRFGDLGAW
jgi:phage gp36-like protein